MNETIVPVNDGKNYQHLSPELKQKILLDLISSTINLNTKDQENIQTIIKCVDALEPRNILEAHLVSQLLALNEAFVSTMATARNAALIETREKAMNLALKCQRGYLKALETLTKLKKGNSYTMRIEHLTIKEGGQAIIGQVGGKGD
jgi:CTP synthase (UTP-ammonia lyase)